MKIKRFLKKLLNNIFSLLIWEIPIVLLFLMIYPKSPDKAIEMQVPGYAIILYDPPYIYDSNQGKKFLINGEEYTVTTSHKPRNMYKLFDMLQKEDNVKFKYFWIGGGKCIVDIRSDSTVYSNYDKRYSTGKIVAFVFCGLAQLAFGIIQSWTLQDIYLDFLDLRDAD
jgi:hypothetical protein